MDAVKCTKKTAQTVVFEGDGGNQSAYFYSKINDKRCYLVFEAIVRLRRGTSCAINEYGVGWGYLSAFALGQSDGRSHGETYHVSSLHHGSPRALLFTPHDEWSDKFQKMSGVGMRWQIQMCKRLKRLEHLFPANALVPRDEPLGGVADDAVVTKGGAASTPRRATRVSSSTRCKNRSSSSPSRACGSPHSSKLSSCSASSATRRARRCRTL